MDLGVPVAHGVVGVTRGDGDNPALRRMFPRVGVNGL